MADFTNLDKYMSPEEEGEEELFPGGIKAITEDEQGFRDMWDSRTPQERIEILRRRPDAAGTVKSTFSAKVLEKMPDDLQNIRLAVKNLSADLGDQVEYAKKNAPNYDWDFSSKGRLIARPKGKKDYYTLDPDTGMFDSREEFGRDTTDIASNIAAGSTEAAGAAIGATALGSLGLLAGPAAPVAVPALSLTGAAIGSGIAGLVNDFANQYISKQVGVRKEIDPASAYDAGKTAAMWGPVFGGGASKSLVKLGAKAVGKQSTKDIAMLYAAQSGAPGQVINASLKRGSALTTGTDKELLDIAVSNTDRMREMSKIEKVAGSSTVKGETQKANFLGKSVNDTVQKSVTEDYGKSFLKRKQLLENMSPINTSPVYRQLDDAMAEIRDVYDDLVISDKKVVDGLMDDLKENIFIETPTNIPHGERMGPTYYDINKKTFGQDIVPRSIDDLSLLVDAPDMELFTDYLIKKGKVDGKHTLSLKGTDIVSSNGNKIRALDADSSQYLKQKLDFLGKSWKAKTDMHTHPKVKSFMAKIDQVKDTLVDEFNKNGREAGWDRFTGGEPPYTYYNNLMRQNRLARKSLVGLRKDPIKFLNNVFSNPKALEELEKASPKALAEAKFLQAYRLWGKRLGQKDADIRQLRPPSTVGTRQKWARGIGMAAYIPAIAMDVAGGSFGAGGWMPYAAGAMAHAGVMGATSPRVIRTAMDATDLIKYLSTAGGISPVGIGGIAPRAITEINRDLDRKRNIN